MVTTTEMKQEQVRSDLEGGSYEDEMKIDLLIQLAKRASWTACLFQLARSEGWMTCPVQHAERAS